MITIECDFVVTYVHVHSQGVFILQDVLISVYPSQTNYQSSIKPVESVYPIKISKNWIGHPKSKIGMKPTKKILLFFFFFACFFPNFCHYSAISTCNTACILQPKSYHNSKFNR